MKARPILPTAFLAYFLLFQVACQPKADFAWQQGDILFQDGECGDFCDAIRAVTSGYEGRDFSHNGFLLQENNEWFVLEAISKGVTKTPLNSFLSRHLDENQKPKAAVGRLKPEFRHLIPRALTEAEKLLGRPYDTGFDLSNDSYYCSELIHLTLQKANHGNPVFEIQPMTFKDPNSKEFFSVWEVYFEKLGMEIPEGKPGLNPGGMSLDPALEMVYDFQQ
ncbi:YiiX/YebB-like N1pC/P60 family cysteine hydrolase [Algoriphagus sp. Y33]|uniref:YiiX/YebB-like N1pC/P60 family cysteine hydrolase n=1 Tax=Algoriphagus sp. Y33 TaxID=2772483 RepID=UPI00177ED88D|nr:YiiX/YebB-like N1pC/P60 family cysteine hydrolase [Algoriphagus sp. Y33]